MLSINSGVSGTAAIFEVISSRLASSIIVSSVRITGSEMVDLLLAGWEVDELVLAGLEDVEFAVSEESKRARLQKLYNTG